MAVTEFIVLCGQVLTTPTGFDIEYWSDGKRFQDRQAAIRNGFDVRGSDDFNIGVLQDGTLISLDWMDEPVDTDPDVLAQIQERGW